MTARDDLLAAARSLTERGDSPFSKKALIQEARAQGCTYKKSTLSTHIGGSMLVGAKNHWGTKYEDFVRVSRGRFALTDDAGGPPVSKAAGQAETPRSESEPPAGGGDHRDRWYWEGSVQASVVRHLASERWDILRVADTHSREHGVDVEARRDGQSLIVEVKGYPSAVYTRGPKKGEPKSGGRGAQARAYFSDALLTGLVMRADRPDAWAVLAFPDFTTYVNLVERVREPLEAAGIDVWVVSESGAVRTVQTDGDGNPEGAPPDEQQSGKPDQPAPSGVPPPAPNLGGEGPASQD